VVILLGNGELYLNLPNSDKKGANTLPPAGRPFFKRLKTPGNMLLHHLPAYRPELNPMERLWCLSNRMYEDCEALFDAGCEAWNRLNDKRNAPVCRANCI
jgi:hypothetical protein